jgi:hypothetical protein
MPKVAKGQTVVELLLGLGLISMVAVVALPGLQGAIVNAFATISGALGSGGGVATAATSGLLSSQPAPLAAEADWGSATGNASSEDPNASTQTKSVEIQPLFSQMATLEARLQASNSNAEYTEVAGEYGQLAQQSLAMALELEKQAGKLDANDPNKASLQEAARYGKALAGTQAALAEELLYKSNGEQPLNTEPYLSIIQLSNNLANETGLFSQTHNDAYATSDIAIQNLPTDIAAMAQNFEKKYNAASATMLADGYSTAQKNTTDQAAASIITNAPVATLENANNTLQNSIVIETTKK